MTKTDSIDKKKIESLLPHREPMLLIDELYDIKKLDWVNGQHFRDMETDLLYTLLLESLPCSF